MKCLISSPLSLLQALIPLFPQSSKTTLRSWIKEGRVQVDGMTVKNPSLHLFKDQLVTIGERKKILRPNTPILYEDHDLVMVDKPSGLLSVSSAFEKGETLHALLKAHYGSRHVFAVHRLDQDTSGVIVFALNQATCHQLKGIFEAHAIERAYTAIVEGQCSPSQGTWRSFLFEDKQYVVHETADETKGRLAVTHFKTLASFKHYSWLELKLETGRKNRIRVHCQSAGHPVAGDKNTALNPTPSNAFACMLICLPFSILSPKRSCASNPPPKEFHCFV